MVEGLYSNDIKDKEYELLRYSFDNHPILAENVNERERYLSALTQIIYSYSDDRMRWDFKRSEFAETLEVNIEYSMSSADIIRFSKPVKRKISFWRKEKTLYSYILILESLYFIRLLSAKIPDIHCFKEFKILKIKEKYVRLLCDYFSFVIDNNYESARQIIESVNDKSIRKQFVYFYDIVFWNNCYTELPITNVAVCATMSAGKSTFINAMLGMDCIPARNEACTDKITIIRDNDRLKKIIGSCVKADGTKIYSNRVDRRLLDEWNDNQNVLATRLEADFEEIGCENRITVIADTPGTNNSGNVAHHGKTLGYIEYNKIDVIVLLFNSEYIGTNDSDILLKEVKSIADKNGARVVFGLNKIDCFDDNELLSIDSMIKSLHDEIIAAGYPSPIIIPFSANAARIFKLVLKGKQLTKKEMREFDLLYQFFTDFNSSEHMINFVGKNNSDYYKYSETDRVLNVFGADYSYNSLISALGNTGIFSLEEIIQKQPNG